MVERKEGYGLGDFDKQVDLYICTLALFDRYIGDTKTTAQATL